MTSPIDNPRETWVFGSYEIYIAGVPIRIPVTGKKPAVIDILTGATVEWNSGAKKMDMTIDPGMGFVPIDRRIFTPTEGGLYVNGTVEADLSGDVTLTQIYPPKINPIAATTAIRGEVGELYANHFRAGDDQVDDVDQGIYTSTNIQLARGGTSTLFKAKANSSDGGDFEIKGAEAGIPGRVGGKLEFGGGRGGDWETTNTDAPGLTVMQLEATTTQSGLFLIRAGVTFSTVFQGQFTLAGNVWAEATAADVWRRSAGTEHDFQIGGVTKGTITGDGFTGVVTYSTTNPSWADPKPTTQFEASERMADAIAIILGGPIP